MEFPADYLLRPVDGHEDLVAFQFDFTLGEKALSESIVEETEDGDLIIEGMAAVFDGLDREGENFAPGAFQRGIKAFLDSQAALCFHHKKDHVLGKVLDLKETADGLWMRARVDGAIRKNPMLAAIYDQIKKGTFNGLSIQGFFRRLGNKIVDMDFTETSVTGVPVHPGTHFSVVAGKALGDFALPIPPDKQAEIREQVLAVENEINSMLTRFDAILTDITKAVIGEEQKTEETDETSGTEAVTP